MITGNHKRTAIGEKYVHKDKRGTGAQTAVKIWDPAPGKGIEVHDFTFTVTLQTRVTVFVGTDATVGADNAEGNRLIDGIYPAGGGESKVLSIPWTLGKDQNIYLTTLAGDIDIVMNGIEQ